MGEDRDDIEAGRVREWNRGCRWRKRIQEYDLSLGNSHSQEERGEGPAKDTKQEESTEKRELRTAKEGQFRNCSPSGDFFRHLQGMKHSPGHCGWLLLFSR